MEQLSVERSIWVAAPRERVWRAVTDAAQIMEWWGGDRWEIPTLEVGAPVMFGHLDDMIHATVAVVDPPREFAIQWPPQEQNHESTIVTRYVLEEERGGTRVTVTESGFEGMPEEIRQQRFDRTAKGYETVLQSLKAFLERESR